MAKIQVEPEKLLDVLADVLTPEAPPDKVRNLVLIGLLRMKKALRAPDYLGHILQAIERIEEYVSDMDEIAFLSNKLVQSAVIAIENQKNVLTAPRGMQPTRSLITQSSCVQLG
jgi:hypothetical protein